MDVAALRGPITVTAAYFVLWYALLFGLQTRTKYRLRREYAARGEVFDRYRSADPEMLKADRAVQNTHEQMVPFLPSTGPTTSTPWRASPVRASAPASSPPVFPTKRACAPRAAAQAATFAAWPPAPSTIRAAPRASAWR